MMRSIFPKLVLILLFSSVCRAAITLPAVFSDHMVLQRDMEFPVWGKAQAGEKIIVKGGGKSATATADNAGKFSCKLPAMSAGETSLVIEGETSPTVTINDVLIGDVWICSGQSNMEFQVKNGKDAEKEIAAATDSKIRVFRVPHVTAVEPITKLEAKWEVCSPQKAGDFTAVGYFFGREIRPARECSDWVD